MENAPIASLSGAERIVASLNVISACKSCIRHSSRLPVPLLYYISDLAIKLPCGLSSNFFERDCLVLIAWDKPIVTIQEKMNR